MSRAQQVRGMTRDGLELFDKISKRQWFLLARDLFEEYESNESDAEGNLPGFAAAMRHRLDILKANGIT